MRKTYQGSCHCGSVKFQATLDLADGTRRCNCTYCTKTRSWNAGVVTNDFTLISGKELLSDYSKDWGQGNIHHRFCSKCGTNLYGHGHIPEMGGDFLSIQVNTLDNTNADELLSGAIAYSDGRNDNWMNPPNDIRTL